jgi:hypothetical protein
MPGAATANQKQQTARATAPFSFWEPPRDPEPAPMRVRLAICLAPPQAAPS